MRAPGVAIRLALRAKPARDWAADHPEWWSVTWSGIAWLLLLFHDGSPAIQALCVAQSRAAGGASVPQGWGLDVPWGMLLDWVVMTLAMVPPLAIPLTRHVATRSFAARRLRATIEFLCGAVLAWLLLGAAGLMLLQRLPGFGRGSPALIGSAFLIAALWQLTPLKRRALSSCHRTVALEPSGWRADRDCARYGFGYGRACAASCWAMMFAIMLGGHGLKSTLCVQAIALAERGVRGPRPWASAAVLAACAAIESAPILLAGQA
jgi:predicted metal-binding membrane protein